MTSPLFKRAFVRGLNAQLIREGVIFYPSKEAADATADFVADQSNMPDPATEGDRLDIKTAGILVNHLIEGAEYQCKQAGNQYNPGVTKTAQEATPESIAYADAIALMEKAAEEHGPNTLQNASPNSAIAASELRERPENYANTGPGIYEPFPSAAQVGIETEPEAPGTQGVPGTNSVVAKSAALQSIVRRIAKTAGNDIGDAPPNDLRAAAKNSDAAKEELEARPEGYANHDEHQGRTEFDIPAAAQAGDEKNITHKSAFDRLFEATAERILPYLPAKMADEQKVAHIRHTMGLDTPERAAYLGNIYLKLGAAQESAKSVHDHFLKAASEEEEEKEKEPKNDDENKEADPDDKEKEPELPAFIQKKESSVRPAPTLATRNTLQGIASRLKNLHA